MSRKKDATFITRQFPVAMRLTALMKENKDTQSNLANVIGKRPQTVSLYCTGQSTPDAYTLLEIADHYNVTVDFLVGRPGAPRTFDFDFAEKEIGKYTRDYLKLLDDFSGAIDGLKKSIERAAALSGTEDSGNEKDVT